MVEQKVKDEEERDKQAARKREQLLEQYNSNIKEIKEANEICKILGKRIKFK